VTNSLRIAPSTSPPASVSSTTPGAPASAPSEEALGGAASVMAGSLALGVADRGPLPKAAWI
jgi:hypothetical protein